MNRVDYNRLFNGIERDGKSLFLHVCCAPCSCGVLPRLDGFDTKAYFYNPNIDTAEEYALRAEQFAKLGVEPMIEEYDHGEFLQRVKGLEHEKEGGARCRVCIAMRLEKTAAKAKELGYDYFCSTLSVSPHKDADFINRTGFAFAEKYDIKFLPNDFKKQNGFLLSTRVSKELGVYRQSYCGCEFSGVTDGRA